MTDADFLIIGGGIAGIAAAYELARVARVRLLEREPRLGYHASGRSAALWSEAFGSDTVRRLTRSSGAFFRDPPVAFAEHPLVRPRGTLFIATASQLASLEARLLTLSRNGVRTEHLDGRSARKRVPTLREEYVAAAFLEPDSQDIDTDLLLQAYARGLRARGGDIVRASEVSALRREHGTWHAETPTGAYRAAVIVNAGGAWADDVAALAGAARLDLTPLRRTAMIFAPTPHTDVSRWPAVADIGEQFYFKPDAGRLLASPADETPSPPCDAAAEELDVALAVERVQRATDLVVPRIEHRFAGLRTFTPDRDPVIGYDGDVPGFFWLAGQGGYGLQTAPAVARAAAALATREPWPEDLAQLGLSAEQLSPGRLGRTE